MIFFSKTIVSLSHIFLCLYSGIIVNVGDTLVRSVLDPSDLITFPEHFMTELGYRVLKEYGADKDQVIARTQQCSTGGTSHLSGFPYYSPDEEFGMIGDNNTTFLHLYLGVAFEVVSPESALRRTPMYWIEIQDVFNKCSIGHEPGTRSVVADTPWAGGDAPYELCKYVFGKCL